MIMGNMRRPSSPSVDESRLGKPLLPPTSVFTSCFLFSVPNVRGCSTWERYLDHAYYSFFLFLFFSLLTTLMTCFRFFEKRSGDVVRWKCCWSISW